MCTTRAAFLGLVSGKQPWGRGSEYLILTLQPPIPLSSQSRPVAVGSRSQAPWAGGDQHPSSSPPWRLVSPRASSLACTCSPSSSHPTPLSLTRWGPDGPGDGVDTYRPRGASFQMGHSWGQYWDGTWLCAQLKCPHCPVPKQSHTLAFTGSLQAGAQLLS